MTMRGRRICCRQPTTSRCCRANLFTPECLEALRRMALVEGACPLRDCADTSQPLRPRRQSTGHHPRGHPFYPVGLGLSGDIVGPFYRTVPLGLRIADVASNHQRLLVGWQGVVRGWDVDTAVLQSTSRATHNFTSGYVDTARLTDALATGLINPFGDSGPTGNALLASTEARGRARESSGTTRSIDFRASRDLMQWSAGTLTLGIGGEARTEALDDRTTSIGDLVVGSVNRPTPKSGKRDAQALYVELAVPIVRTLDAQLALRADRFSDFGVSANPKVALRWQPYKSLLFRTSAGTGFRAPSLPELYAAQGQTLAPTDPVQSVAPSRTSLRTGNRNCR